jgi:hypothetical protein
MWFDILKIPKIFEYWFKGKEDNSIIVQIPYEGFLPDKKSQIDYVEKYWVQNHNIFKEAIGRKIEANESFSLTLINTEIIDTSEQGFSWGFDSKFKEIKDPNEIKLDNWLKVSYIYNILIDLDEEVLMDRIEEDDFTAKW